MTRTAHSGPRRSRTMFVNRCAPHAGARFGQIARAAARWSRAALPALILIASCGAARQPAGADAEAYQNNHIYVHYTAQWVPSPDGILADVTSDLVSDNQGHVFDLHGNVLDLDWTRNEVSDANGS